jgi:hypothetical protein
MVFVTEFVTKSYQATQILFYQNIEPSSSSMVVSGMDIQDADILLFLKPGQTGGCKNLRPIREKII